MRIIVLITLPFLLSFCNNWVSYPKEKCMEELNVLNIQAFYSFGQSCFYSTPEYPEDNKLRCQTLILINMQGGC